MKASVAAAIITFAAVVAAGPTKPYPLNSFSLKKRASVPIPESKGTETLNAAMEVTDFDGGMKTYGRGVSCTGQTAGSDSDAVFIVKDGGSLSNLIIGEDQIAGVHCKGSCTITNVWWDTVCEDALTLNNNGKVIISGGGATGAEDKVIQHNGIGTVTIDDFTIETFGTFYNSCGNCKESAERHVVIKNVKAFDGNLLASINSNFGDTATIESTTCATNVEAICEEFEATTSGNEPESISEGPSTACKYTESLSLC